MFLSFSIASNRLILSMFYANVLAFQKIIEHNVRRFDELKFEHVHLEVLAMKVRLQN